MQIREQSIKAGDVLDILDRRIQAVTDSYHYAKGSKNELSAQCLAETKWQLAELKMQFSDFLCKQLEDSKNVTTN